MALNPIGTRNTAARPAAGTGTGTGRTTGEANTVVEITPALIQRELQTLPIPPATLRTQLDGFTLIWANTNIYADAGEEELTTTVLGQSVTITATPVSYRFTYGDGASTTTSDPGHPVTGDGFDIPTDTGHVYEDTGKFSVTLTTTYTGEFSVDGQQAQDIPGTTPVTSDPVTIDVWRTRHYRVEEPCTAGTSAPGCVPPADATGTDAGNNTDSATRAP